MSQEFVILYNWEWGHQIRTRIEMRGIFTEERWQQFKKKPHPTRTDVVVTEICRNPAKE